MPSLNQTIDRSLSISRGVATVLDRRLRDAFTTYADRVRRAHATYAQSGALAASANPQTVVRDWWEYNIDFAQRSILFWDTLRQRGNNWIAHEEAGKPPVFAYEYEMLADGRTFE